MVDTLIVFTLYSIDYNIICLKKKKTAKPINVETTNSVLFNAKPEISESYLYGLGATRFGFRRIYLCYTDPVSCLMKSRDTHILSNNNNKIKPDPDQVPVWFKHRDFFRSDHTRLSEKPGFYQH